MLSCPAEADLRNIFWAEPEVLAEWLNRINEVTLSTMSMGALTHEAQNQPLLECVVDIFGLEDKPIRTDVMNAGIMYGAIVARESARLQGRDRITEDDPLTPEQAARAVSIVLIESDILPSWMDRERVNHVVDLQKGALVTGQVNATFMKLREMEVKLLGSDVLATTLAVAQDHILNQVYQNLDIEDDQTRSAVSKDAQVLFYAGALAGALRHYAMDGDFPTHLPTIQLHRGIQDNDVLFASIVEFESGDDVREIIQYALENKYTFKGGRLKLSERSRGRKIVGVFPSGVQTDPNGITLPLPGITDFPWQTVEYRDVKHMLMARRGADSDKIDYKIVKADDEAWEEFEGDEWKTTALLCKDNICISALDIAHPDAIDVDTFMCNKLGIKPGSLKYANELQAWEIMGIPRQLRNLGKVTVAGAIGPWVFEATERLLFNHGDMVATIATSGVCTVLGASIAVVKRRLNKHSPLERYDRIIYNQTAEPEVVTAS